MLVFATVAAYEAGQLQLADWSMTDAQFFESLRTSPIAAVKETATRWFVGELWDMAPLAWFEGERPDYAVSPQLLGGAVEPHGSSLFSPTGLRTSGTGSLR